MITVGVTGGIASGKSTLVEEWERLGARAVDADRVGWRLLERAEIRESILYAFGTDVLGESGEIDRPRLAEVAFRDDDSVETLGAILHPPILAELEEWTRLERERDDSGVAVIEASVIIEAGGTDLVDYLVVVTSPVATRIARLERRGVSRDDALARMRHQTSDEQKRAVADFVVENDGTREELIATARALWEKISRLPGRPRDGSS